jgi:nitrate/nitrite transporter NarK
MASGTWSLASDAAIWSLTNVITYNAAINAREKCQQWQLRGSPEDYRFIIMIFQYFACFGTELTVSNQLAGHLVSTSSEGR